MNKLKHKNRKNLCIFVATLTAGGAEHVAISLASGIKKIGYYVDLVVCNASGPLRYKVDQDVRIINLDCGKVKSSIMPFRRYILENKPDAIISIQTDCNIALLITNLLVNVKVLVIITEHSLLNKPDVFISLNKWIRRVLQFILYREADHMVAVSKGVLNDFGSFLKCFSPPSSVIYNPVFTEKFINRNMLEIFNNNNNCQGKPFFLGVGRLTKAKGFDLLINAYSRIATQTDHNLIILGEGEEREVLEKLIRKHGLNNQITLKGYVTDPYKYYKKASVFVLSSYWEGFGLVLVEALACGLKIISTDCPGGPREILSYGEYGVIVPPNDANALAEAMKAQLEIVDNMDDIIKRKARAKTFSIESAAKQYHKLLINLGL